MWHLDIPTQDELRALANVRASAVVSLYLPTTPVTPHVQGDTLTFRNLADEAVGALRERPRPARGEADAIAEQLEDLLDDRPLVLVATQPIDGIFRQVYSYPHLVSEGVQASADRWSLTEVAEAVAPVLLSHQDAIDADLATLIDERRGQGRVAEDVADIARAVTMGAVDTLVIDRDHDERGTIDEAGALVLDPEAGLIADELAHRTVLASGQVLAVEASRLPGESAAVAVLRYSV